jgi:hypothetical protein
MEHAERPYLATYTVSEPKNLNGNSVIAFRVLQYQVAFKLILREHLNRAGA